MIDSARVCRVCLKEDGEMNKLFAVFGDRLDPEKSRLDTMLILSTQVKVIQNDGLPEQICLNCTERLLNAFEFKKMCQQSDIALKKNLLKHVCNNSKPNRKEGIKQEVAIGMTPGIIDFNSILSPEITPVKVESNQNHVTFINYNDNNLKDVTGTTPEIINLSSEKSTQTAEINLCGLHNCPECQKKFRSLTGLTEHVKKKHSSNTFVTSKCTKIASNAKEPEKHNSNTHNIINLEDSITKDYKCITCDKQFSNKCNLEKHERSHKKRKTFTCSKCNKIYDNLVFYESHNCENSHKCITCKKCFTSATKLEQHMKEAHKDTSENCESQNKDNIVVADDQLEVECVKNEDISIKEEPLEDILDEAERENHVVAEDSNSFVDMDIDDLDFKEYLEDSDYRVAKVKKKNSHLKKSLKKKQNLKVEKNNISKDSTCDKSFSSKIVLEKLQAIEHGLDQLIHMCKICNKFFDNKDFLEEHELSHNLEPKKFECEQCDKIFYKQEYLNKHIWQHMEQKPFQCNLCSKGFLKQQHLDRHKLALHSGKEKNPKTAYCDICCRGFTTAKYLETHMRMHTGDKTFTCDVCNKSFNSKWHLKEHNRWHSTEKPFLCSECGQRFIRNDYLVIHMRRHKGEKPYKCKFCNKGFPRATDLTVHERYHTGEKTHLCTICGKGFQRQYNLTVHLRVHTGERPYVCSYCGKKFAQGNDLKSHVRRHTGERFNCDVCGEGFIQGYHLTQHKRTVHGIDCSSHIRRVEKHPQAPENAVLQLALVPQNAKSISMDNGVINNDQNQENLTINREAGRPIVPIVPVVMFTNVHSRT